MTSCGTRPSRRGDFQESGWQNTWVCAMFMQLPARHHPGRRVSQINTHPDLQGLPAAGLAGSRATTTGRASRCSTVLPD